MVCGRFLFLNFCALFCFTDMEFYFTTIKLFAAAQTLQHSSILVQEVCIFIVCVFSV
jgi:hypothetical protein